jgi:hypothetical protein
MSMESSTRASALLPEAAPIPPSEALRRSAPLADAAAYLSLLAQSRHDPEGFWMRQARDLSWSREPEALGGPGRFFPGGSLNLCRECLDRHRTQDERRSALIAADAGGALRRLSRGELGQKVGALAGRLAGWALSPGQRVLLLLPPGEDLAAALLAVWRLGLCARVLPGWGAGGRLQRLSATFRVPVRPGVPLIVSAVVTEKHQSERGNFLECDLVLENADGDRLVTGTATVAF